MPQAWKNSTALVLLFLSNAISGVAQGISMIAVPWYFTKSGEVTLFGIIYASVTAISLVWGPYSGVLIDKHDRRSVFLVLSFVMGLLLMAVAALGYWQQQLEWYWVALVFMATLLNYSLHYPTVYAFVQEVTEPKHYATITSYLEVVGQVTTVMAGAAAALLLEGTQHQQTVIFGLPLHLGFDFSAWQIYDIFLLDGITYFVAIILLYFIKYKPLAIRHHEQGNVIKRLEIGWHYLTKNKDILLFGVTSFCVFAATLITTFFIGAVYVANHLGRGGDVYASADMFYALGAIFSGIAIRWVFRRVTTIFSIIAMTFVCAILFFVLSLTKSIAIFYLMLFLLGVTNAGIRVQRVVYLFQHIPNQVQGRTGSIFFMVNILFRVFFILIFSLPFFQQDNNIVYSCTILGVFLLAAGSLMVVNYDKLNTIGQGEI